MRILIVNRALGTLFGGGESFDLNAARYLARRGHEVTLVTGKPVGGRPNNLFDDVHVEYLPTPQLRRFAYATQQLHDKVSAAFYHADNMLFERAVRRWLQAGRLVHFDIVQCCSLFGLPAWLLRQGGVAPVSWLPGPPSGRIRRRLPQLLERADFGLYTHGSPEWSLMDMGLQRGRDYETIGPGVELATIDATPRQRVERRRTLGLGDDALLGLTAARLIPVKNLGLLLQALALARQRGAPWHWAFLGDGPLKADLQAQAASLGLAGHVHFLGHQPQREVHGWMAAVDLFALSSRYENFSIAALEAMGHRLPVLGTDVGYLRELIEGSGAGVVTTPDDAGRMSDALVRMTDSALRTRHGEQGRDFVAKLDWPMVAGELEALYRRVMAGQGARVA